MFRRGFVPVVVIALFLITVFSGTALVAWRTTLLDSYLPQSVKDFLGKTLTGENGSLITSDNPEPSGEDSEPTAEDPTKDWETYTNTEIGFSFKYPENWVEREDQTSAISFESADGIVGLSVYKDFQGGFESEGSVETKNYYTADDTWVPATVAYSEDDPNNVSVFGGPYNRQPSLTFLYRFNLTSYSDGLEVFELILSTFRFL